MKRKKIPGMRRLLEAIFSGEHQVQGSVPVDPKERKAKDEFIKKGTYEHKYRERLEGVGKLGWPGLCGSCSHLSFVETAHGSKIAECGDGKFDGKPMNLHDPVVKCSSYWPRSAITLSEMAEQARYIVVIDRPGQYL